jgi:hypothetical protein
MAKAEDPVRGDDSTYIADELDCEPTGGCFEPSAGAMLSLITLRLCLKQGNQVADLDE